MTVKRLILTLDPSFYNKIIKRSMIMGFSTPQKYLYDLARRNIYEKQRNGRPKTITADESFARKFALPTKASRKIWKENKRQGMG